MRNLLIILASALFLTSCNGCETEPQVSRYEKRYGPNGDSTVYVHYVDDNGTDRSFFMDYLLFSTLYNSGGYRSCYGYYNSHPAYFNTPNYARYNSYRSHTTINNHYGSSGSRSSHYNSSSSNKSRISSSPSRSSSSSFYRSSSSPSRSYSSPYRSSSSPSRSFSRSSSPSRSSSSRGSSSRH